MNFPYILKYNHSYYKMMFNIIRNNLAVIAAFGIALAVTIAIGTGDLSSAFGSRGH